MKFAEAHHLQMASSFQLLINLDDWAGDVNPKGPIRATFAKATRISHDIDLKEHPILAQDEMKRTNRWQSGSSQQSPRYEHGQAIYWPIRTAIDR
ncbi:hypothetical protein Ciccas_002345 [Cichlidogyrus casuarinus]|uniref:Uncharacterized protein n=1 Tax=Cichlidogyrus casuarinus TaxID=1844966 RepID=A0ABD2QHI3_9PLAT